MQRIQFAILLTCLGTKKKKKKNYLPQLHQPGEKVSHNGKS